MIYKNNSVAIEEVGDLLLIRLRGEIDHHSAVYMREEADRLIFEKRPARVALDLSDIEFMDSSGLGLIMGRYATSRKVEATLVIVNPTPPVTKILELAGIERIIKIERIKRVQS